MRTRSYDKDSVEFQFPPEIYAYYFIRQAFTVSVIGEDWFCLGEIVLKLNFSPSQVSHKGAPRTMCVWGGCGCVGGGELRHCALLQRTPCSWTPS